MNHPPTRRQPPPTTTPPSPSPPTPARRAAHQCQTDAGRPSSLSDAPSGGLSEAPSSGPSDALSISPPPPLPGPLSGPLSDSSSGGQSDGLSDGLSGGATDGLSGGLSGGLLTTADRSGFLSGRWSTAGPVTLTGLTEATASWSPLTLAACFVAIATVVAGALTARQMTQTWRHRRLTQGARWITIAAPVEVAASSAGEMWMTLAGVLTPARWQRLLYGSAHVGWEYRWAGQTLTIGVWVPGTIPPGAVEAAVTAAWPGATLTTEPATDPIPTTVNGQAGGALWPQDTPALPLRTDHTVDPLRAMLATGASVRPHEFAVVQILARPAAPRRLRAARRALRHPTTTGAGAGVLTGPAETATRLTTAGALTLIQPVLWLTEAMLPGRTSPRTRTPAPGGGRIPATGADPLREAHRRAMIDKATKVPHFEIAVRYAVATTQPPTPNQRRQDRKSRPAPERMTGLAHTLAASAATYTRPNRLRRMKMPHPVAVIADRRLHRGFIASVEELAARAALPQDLAVPGLDRARAKAMPAPVAVPAGGRGVKVLGRAQIGGRSVAMNVTDTRQHVHLIGKTGAGKSTLLLNMVLSDIHAGRGAVVIDPRGDLITDILDRIPLTAAKRTVIIDPDQTNPGCFNPLDTTGTDPHLAVDNLVGIFSKIFARHWGPRIDDTLRVSCLSLMRRPNPTLAMIPQLLNDRAYRAQFTAGLTDPEGLAGYWKWYDSMNDGLRAQVIGPVLARLRAFLLRDFVKDVIGTPRSSFDMPTVLNGGLLLCRLPKGILGEETARILGSLIVARVWQAAIARAAQPEPDRRDATLYIDECQNFLTLPGSVDDMLAEARGFRLGLVMAHQNLAQLPTETQAAISANARSKIYFTVAPEDARDLSKHTLPELDDHDLAHLDAHTATARLLVNGRELPAFTFTTNPPTPTRGHLPHIRAACADPPPHALTTPRPRHTP